MFSPNIKELLEKVIEGHANGKAPHSQIAA